MLSDPKINAAPIPLSAPNIAGNEWKYVKECLDTGWVSSVGSYVDKFEGMMARETDCSHAVATTCGTAALHMALMVAGVQPGDEVLMPSLTFVAPANAVRYLGAWPVFLDSDQRYWQLDPEKLKEFLSAECIWREKALYNKHTGRKIAAILPVHVLGHPCPMEQILALAAQYGLVVVEDATESLGSTHLGRKTGSIGRLGCFSFNGNKLITTGGGGMITTNDSKLAQRARYLTTQAKDDPIEFVHGAVGYNYRLTNVQAAMGCAQLEMLPAFLAKKREIVSRYTADLGGFALYSLPEEASWARTNWWLYTIRVPTNRTGASSRSLIAAAAAQSIQCRPFWQPMHLSPAHTECFSWRCDTAAALWRECVSLPCSTHLSESDQARVCDMLKSIAERIHCKTGE
jgi:perosamine synthetase